MLLGEVFAKMGLDDRDYDKALDAVEGRTRRKAATLGGIFKGALSFSLGMGLISGFRSLGGAVTQFITTASRTEVLDVALTSVARSSGYVTEAILQQRAAIMGLGVAEQGANQILTRFMQAQLDTADAAKIARVAQDAAVISGTNSTEAAQQMTEAIAKQRPQLLAAFGMTRNLNDIYGDYAKTLGKSSSSLSETEKRQAMVNYIMSEGEKIAGTYEASMGAVGKQIGSLPRYWETLQNAVAKPLALPALGVIVDGITNGLKSAIEWARNNTTELKRWGQGIANVARLGVKGFGAIAQAVAQNWTAIKIATIALVTYKGITVATNTATAAWAFYQKLLNAEMVKSPGLMGLAAVAAQAYAIGVAAAPAATGAFTASLYGLAAALKAVWVALGPVGWAVLAISAGIGIGTTLWGKYNKSLQQTGGSAKGVATATKSANAALEDQKDALEGVGDAAGNSLQSFDEVHQLQEDMGGGLDLPGIDGLEMPAIDPAALLADMQGALEGVKPTWAGFWEWLKTGTGNALKSIWTGATGFLGDLFAPMAASAKGLWTDVLVPFGKWVGGVFAGAWNLAGIAWTWFKDSVLAPIGRAFVWLWQSVLVPIGQFIVGMFTDPWGTLGNLWLWLKDSVLTPLGAGLLWVWQTLLVPIGEFIGSIFTGAWNALGTLWLWIKDGVLQPLGNALLWVWNEVLTPIGAFVAGLFLAAFEGTFATIGDLIDGAKRTFGGLIDFVAGVFTGDWKRAWQGVKDIFGGIFDSLWGLVKRPLNLIIGGVNWLISGLNKISFSFPSWVPGVGGKSFGISIPPITPLATGTNFVPQDMLAYLHKGEAVVPKQYNPAQGGAEGVGGAVAEQIERAVYRAMIDAQRLLGATQGGSGGQVEPRLELDGVVLARLLLPYISQEAQRQGVRIIDTGGVR